MNNDMNHDMNNDRRQAVARDKAKGFHRDHDSFFERDNAPYRVYSAWYPSARKETPRDRYYLWDSIFHNERLSGAVRSGK